jgi:4-amino-4-deoxy-L-arabinose transferase-like glycosyltransferase
MKAKRKWSGPFFLFFFSLPLFFIGLQDTQSWGDDFAQYITEAKNIAAGRPYHAGLFFYNPLNTEYAPPSYPPGFPLLLAPVIFFFGDSISPMLLLISALMVLLVFVVYNLYRPYFSERSAIFLALLTAYSAAVLDLKWYVLSDLPLLFFSSLYLLMRRREYVGFLGSCLLAALLAFTCLVRSQALLLVVAELMVFAHHRILKRKREDSTGQILIMFTLIYGWLHMNVLSGSAGGSDFYLQLFQGSFQNYWQLITDNSVYLLELLQSFFIFRTDNGYVYRLELLVGTFLALVFLIALIRRLFQKPDLHSWYALALCLMILILPVRQGLRYLLPLLPIFVYFNAEFLRDTLRSMNYRVPALLFPVACYLYLLLSLPKLKDKPYDANWTPYTPKDKAVFEWLRTNLDSTTIVVSTKPRALHLFTGLPATVPAWMKSAAENKAFFTQHQVRHFLARTDLDWDMIERYLRESGTVSDTLRITDSYTLFIARTP